MKTIAFLAYLAIVYVALFTWFTPTVEDLTPAEKDAAMAEALREQPFEEMTDAERAQDKAIVEQMADDYPAEIIWTGTFQDRVHVGAGSAQVVSEDGDLKLILDDNFKSDAGPNLHVFVTGHEDPQESADIHAVGDADLGPLKSTFGTQVYDIPDDIDFDIQSVVVYCVPFKVLFTSAI